MVKCGPAAPPAGMRVRQRTEPLPHNVCVRQRTEPLPHMAWLSIRNEGIVNDGLVWVESVVSAEGGALQSLLC